MERNKSRYLIDRMTDTEYIEYLECCILDLEQQLLDEKKRFNDRVDREFKHAQKMIGVTISAALNSTKA